MIKIWKISLYYLEYYPHSTNPHFFFYFIKHINHVNSSHYLKKKKKKKKSLNYFLLKYIMCYFIIQN